MYVSSLGGADPVFPASVERWREPLLMEAPDLPISFLLAWLKHESGGNPCSVGIPGVEAGMFQTFHPADDRFGATFAQLRAGCTGSTTTGTINAAAQVKSGANYVRSKRDAARAHLARVGANWSESSPDFWAMVKQEHALPCVAIDLLPLVARKLGRAPASWAEFRATVMSTSASEMPAGCARFAASPSKRGLRNRLEDTMANAEAVGVYGTGGASESTGGSKLALLLLLGGLGVLAGMTLRQAKH